MTTAQQPCGIILKPAFAAGRQVQHKKTTGNPKAVGGLYKRIFFVFLKLAVGC
jgi:hypothetical protein